MARGRSRGSRAAPSAGRAGSRGHRRAPLEHRLQVGAIGRELEADRCRQLERRLGRGRLQAETGDQDRDPGSGLIEIERPGIADQRSLPVRPDPGHRAEGAGLDQRWVERRRTEPSRRREGRWPHPLVAAADRTNRRQGHRQLHLSDTLVADRIVVDQPPERRARQRHEQTGEDGYNPGFGGARHPTGRRQRRRLLVAVIGPCGRRTGRHHAGGRGPEPADSRRRPPSPRRRPPRPHPGR